MRLRTRLVLQQKTIDLILPLILKMEGRQRKLQGHLFQKSVKTQACLLLAIFP